MLTDLRPIVERILRQMLVAGLPAVMASCSSQGMLQVAAPGSGGTSVGGSGGTSVGGRGGTNVGGRGGTNVGGGGGTSMGGRGGTSVDGRGGTNVGGGVGGRGGTNVGGGGSSAAGQGGTSVAGNGGAGGSIQDAGMPADAPSGIPCAPLEFTNGVRTTGCGGTSGFTIGVNMTTVAFDPNDPRWADLFRTCVPPVSDPLGCADACLALIKTDGGSTVGHPNYLDCKVACDDPAALTVSYQNVVCGRRAGGPCLDEALEPTGPALGRYLARAARLEAESVPAFARVSRGLARAGAPSPLIRDARTAMADEARHWRRTRDLARKRGADPARPVVRSPEFASLADLALDNLVEGCIRETFGALVAAHQAATARDPDVRALMTEIAHDELAHANLSWRIDAWAAEALGPAFEARRREAATGAISELVAGVAGIRDDDHVLRDAGLPDQEGSRALLGATWAHVWKHAFAPAT